MPNSSSFEPDKHMKTYDVALLLLLSLGLCPGTDDQATGQQPLETVFRLTLWLFGNRLEHREPVPQQIGALLFSTVCVRPLIWR
jgi:hypothetical protein